MSDPMTNREIEDVLSSIRRLVTHGDTASAPAAGSETGKLVLTPAFRVAEPAAPAETPAPSLEQTIAELEAAIANLGGPFEPDEGDAAAPAAPVVMDDDKAILSVSESVSMTSDPAKDAPADKEMAVLGDDDEMIFDEAMLRELVTDILREELQGALGQRITRNVRKLVRSEIARALASRDLG